MKQRSPIAVFLLSLITFGIYGLVWYVKTKNEMNSLGADIPTAWLLVVPFANLYWMWKYCAGVEKVTGGKMSQVLAFVLLFLLGTIGSAILQSEFNKVGSTLPATGTQAVPVAADPLPAGPNPYAPAVPQTPTVAPVVAAPVGDAAPAQVDPTTGQPATIVSPTTTPQV